jgi:hypothetical protein
VEICGWEARIGVGWLEVRFGGADILPLPPTELGIMPGRGSPPPLERRARRRRLGGETCSWLAAAGVCGAVGRAETGVRPPPPPPPVGAGSGGVERLGMPPGWRDTRRRAGLLPLFRCCLSIYLVATYGGNSIVLVCLACWVGTVARTYRTSHAMW